MAGDRSVRGLVIAGWLLVGCGGAGSEPASAAVPAKPAMPALPAAAPPAPEGPAPHPDASLPVSKRMQGRWRLDIDQVPDIALTKQFRELKKQGKGKQVRMEYTVTDTEFTLAAYGDRGPTITRFSYEIASEESDRVLLKRLGEDGKEQQINVVLRDDDVLRMGTGSGEVPLQRVALPEKPR